MPIETPPGYEPARGPEDLKNAVFLVQAMLMGRNPAGEEDWGLRHAAAFRRLFDADDAFRAMLLEEMTPEHLRKVQDRLDAEH